MIKLTKYVHSCLLAEAGNISVLFDPGTYSWNSGIFNTDKHNHLNAVVITHEHPDHFSEEFVKFLHETFPDLTFIAPPKVTQRLKAMGIKNASPDSNESIEVFSNKPHADTRPLLDTLPPENIAVHFADKLTVGGDRHDLEESKAVLAFPITAPWGSVKEGAEMVMHLKPKYAFPLHDWHWSPTAREAEYERSGNMYSNNGINFLKPHDGETIEIEV